MNMNTLWLFNNDDNDYGDVYIDEVLVSQLFTLMMLTSIDAKEVMELHLRTKVMIVMMIVMMMMVMMM